MTRDDSRDFPRVPALNLRLVLPILQSMACSLAASLAVFVVVYYLKLETITDFFPRFGLYIFPAMVAYAFLIATVRQALAYGRFACMAGMMIGMTMGMIGGFLAGYYVGATNGLFVGSVFGMITGIALGVWTGTGSGVMGFMEGMMAGLMSGPMGAMTAVMLLADHAQAMGVIIFVVGMVILGALNYMIFVEKAGEELPRNQGHFRTVLASLVLTGATIGIMAFGPSSICPCKTLSAGALDSQKQFVVRRSQAPTEGLHEGIELAIAHHPECSSQTRRGGIGLRTDCIEAIQTYRPYGTRDGRVCSVFAINMPALAGLTPDGLLILDSLRYAILNVCQLLVYPCNGSLLYSPNKVRDSLRRLLPLRNEKRIPVLGVFNGQ